MYECRYVCTCDVWYLNLQTFPFCDSEPEKPLPLWSAPRHKYKYKYKYNEFALPLIYKAMVRPFLEYGNVIWGPFGKTDQTRLERVQRRATRMAETVRLLRYSERRRRLGLPSLYYRRRRRDMIVLFQLFHGGLDEPPETFLCRTLAADKRPQLEAAKTKGKNT